MKFFGMVAMMALVSTVAFAEDHAAPGHSAPAVHDTAEKAKADAGAVENATATGGKKVSKAGRKAAKKMKAAAEDVQKAQGEATEKAAEAHH